MIRLFLSLCIALLPLFADRSGLNTGSLTEVQLKSHQVLSHAFPGGLESYLAPSYALIIANSDYEHNSYWDDLPSIPKEVQEIIAALKKQGFKEEHIFSYANLTGAQLKSTFEQFIYKYGFIPKNRLFIFYSGHGESDPDGTNGYLVGTDARSIKKGMGDFYARSLSMRQINTLAKDMKALHAFFAFDSCFSGSILALKGSSEEPPSYLYPSIARKSRQFLTAGSANQKVPSQSQFSPMLAQVLRGEKGDINQDGFISGEELGVYIKKNLIKYVDPNLQTPQFGSIADVTQSQGDFIFLADNFVPLPKGPTESELQKLRQQKEALEQQLKEQAEAKKRAEEAERIQKETEALQKKLAQQQAEQEKLKEQQLKAQETKAHPTIPQQTHPTHITPALTLIQAKGQTFTMGSKEGDDDEKDLKQVTFDYDFYLGTYEVTMAEYQKFIDDTGYQTEAERNVREKGCYAFKSGDGWDWREGYSWKSPGFDQTSSHPVVCISWNDAQQYIDWLNQKEGLSKTGSHYRLPTEAEWEYAARANTPPHEWKWSFGSDEKDLCTYGNVADETKSPEGSSWNNKAPCQDSYWFTAPKGSFKPNPFDLHDMIGNVWEWTEDWYKNSYNGTPKDGSANTTGEQKYRSSRGGGWVVRPEDARSASRSGSTPDVRVSSLGFRLLRTL